MSDYLAKNKILNINGYACEDEKNVPNCMWCDKEKGGTIAMIANEACDDLNYICSECKECYDYKKHRAEDTYDYNYDGEFDFEVYNPRTYTWNEEIIDESDEEN